MDVYETPDLTIKQARIIEAVARHSEIGRAADSLNTSPSTVSRALSAAETLLGVSLFDRGWGGTEPTSEGEVAAVHCANIIRYIRQAEDLLAKTADGPPRLMPFLEWRHLNAADLVGKLNSATAAAQRLETSQPAISRTLKELTDYARQPLFLRSHGGLQATEGVTVLARLRSQLATEINTILGSIEGLAHSLTGRISVGVLPFSDEKIIAKVFSKMIEQHPYARLMAMPGTYNILSAALLRGEIDCMVGLLRDPSTQTGLTQIPITKERYTIVACAGHACHKTKASVDDLTKYNWLVGPHGNPLRIYFDQLFSDPRAVPQIQTCQMMSFDWAEEMLMESECLALLLYSDKNHKTLRPELKVVDVSMPNSEVDIGLVVREGATMTPAMKIFYEFLTAELKAS